MAHVGDGDLLVGDPPGQPSHLVVRALQELVEQPEFAKQLQRRGVNRVAAEIAEEVGVLLEHLHLAAGAREQQAGHHPGWSAADDDKVERAVSR